MQESSIPVNPFLTTARQYMVHNDENLAEMARRCRISAYHMDKDQSPYMTNTKTVTAEEMRQSLLDLYIEKLMSLIDDACEMRQVTFDVKRRDADMMPAIRGIMIDLGYSFRYTEDNSMIHIEW